MASEWTWHSAMGALASLKTLNLMDNQIGEAEHEQLKAACAARGIEYYC